MADFGEVTLELQLFEAALLGLALARGWTPERHGSDEWGEHIEKLFGLTAGRLVRVAQIEDEVSAERVKKTVELRNGTVHHWLIYTGMDLASGKSTIEKERADRTPRLDGRDSQGSKLCSRCSTSKARSRCRPSGSPSSGARTCRPPTKAEPRVRPGLGWTSGATARVAGCP